jgi:tetratricopeptide (TPR) repeat protein
MRLSTLMLLVLLPNAVIASPKQEAETARQAALAAYDAQDFRLAAEQFTYSYVLDGKAASLYNLGDCLSKAGKHQDAAFVFERYAGTLNDAIPKERDFKRLVSRRAEESRKRSGAPTQPLAAEAKSALAAAKYATERKEHPLALSFYYRAYILNPSPALVHTIAIAEEGAGRFAEAANLLDRYVELVASSPEVDEATREEARTRAYVNRGRVDQKPASAAPPAKSSKGSVYDPFAR